MRILSSLWGARRRDVLDDFDASSLLLTSKFGRRLRLGIITATVVSYPVISLFLNGPLLNRSFPYFHKEYERYLKKENKKSKDVNVTFYRSDTASGLDSSVKGALALKFGVNIAFPFYVGIENKEDASDYCKRNLKHFLFYGDAVKIIWDSDIGKAIAETFYLSDKALRFLVLRDLYANEDYRSFVSKELSWAGYSSLAGFFTFFLHGYSKYRHSLQWFLLILLATTTLAYFGSKYWYQLYRHIADLKADEKAALTSPEHHEGGKEYYWKMLQRNRFLRSTFSDVVSKKVTSTGDMKSITTPFFKRYLELKRLRVDDDCAFEED